MGGNPGRIDETAVGNRYGEWFTRGLRGIGMRYVFSRRGLWVINTPYRRILGAAAVTREDRVLDLGCGIGNILIALAERIDFVHPAAVSCFREVARVLRPGGRFLLWEFDRSPRSALLFWSARLSGLPPPFQLRTSAEFSRVLRSTGFHRVVRFDPGFFLLPPVPRLALLATR